MMQSRRQLKFTREGKYFVAMTLGIGFAAVNTGNNLLYLVLGMLLSLIVGSGVLSELALRGLTVRRRVPNRIFAGQPTLIGLELGNTKQRLPSFSLVLEDRLGKRLLGPCCSFLKLAAREVVRGSYPHIFAHRGRHSFEGVRVHTTFPFSLFRKSRDIVAREEVIVLPAIHPVRPPAGQAAACGEQPGGGLRQRGELYGLREYREGDDPQDIHWRKSACRGRLVVREYEAQSGTRVTIYLDNRRTGNTAEDRVLEERAVSRAASLAVHHAERGHAVQLITRTGHVGPGSGPTHLSQMLRALALVEFVVEERAFAPAAQPLGACLVVNSRGAVASGLPGAA